MGFAFPLPDKLLHPLTFCVTDLIPAVNTVIEVVVAAVLHNNVPSTFVTVSIELLQVSLTATIGVEGITFGAAIALPGGLTQPVTVCVTVYVPAVLTVIEVVPAPVLHNNVPVCPLAVNKELPQLLVGVMVGAIGIVFGVAFPVAVLVHKFAAVNVTVYNPAVATVIVGVTAPVLHNNVPVKLLAVKSVLPQPSVGITVGAAGTNLGVEVPLPGALVHVPSD